MARQELLPDEDQPQKSKPLEWIPLEFRYRFRCADTACTGHDMLLRDWEAGQSYRNFAARYDDGQLKDKLREQWFTKIVTPQRAVHFFVGNIAAYPRTFMLLGLFYPPRSTMEAQKQMPLF